MKPQVKNALKDAPLTYKGGGWYELPDGRRERGAENALQVLNHTTPSSARTDRLRFIRKAGFQHDGERNVYKTAGYIPEGNLRFEHYFSYYDRHDVAGRIVDMAPQTTWRDPPDVMEGQGEDARDDTDFVDAFDELVDRLGLWHRFERADRLSRIGRFGVLLIGLRGADDRTLREPVEPGSMTDPDDVLYLSAFPEGDVDIVQWVTDTSDPRFGQPLRYEIDLSSGVPNFPQATRVVHHSRVLHIAEDLLADEVYGRPVLRRVMNRIFDDEKVMASTGEAFWQLADQILVASIDPEARLDTDTRDDMGEALEEMVHKLRRQFVGSGVDLSMLGGETPDPTGPADVLAARIAAGGGYPKRVLFGTETGERASTEDQKTYLGSISERQERIAEPLILRAFIDRLVQFGALPAPGDDGYSVTWPTLFELDEQAKADIALKVAQAAKALTPVGGDPRQLITVDEEGMPGLRALTEEDVDDLAAAPTLPNLPSPPPEGELAA